MDVSIWHWIGFNLVIIGLLAADLVYFKRFPHRLSLKEALYTSAGWVAIALLFNLWIYIGYGKEPALTFLTGYLLEASLSVDNLFVILIIFSYFNVPSAARHSVLFWGILGAIVMRAGLIAGGIFLIVHFKWMFYLFGAFLIYTGYRLMANKETKKIDYKQNIVYRLLSHCIPLTNQYQGNAFLIKEKGRWIGTPLLAVLLIIETTDLIFALDSVPAILGITTDPFIVYTSNICAILGLRSFFFVLEGMMQKLYLIHYALAAILIFIGVKMMAMDFIHIPTLVSLGIIVGLILVAAVASFLVPKEDARS